MMLAKKAAHEVFNSLMGRDDPKAPPLGDPAKFEAFAVRKLTRCIERVMEDVAEQVWIVLDETHDCPRTDECECWACKGSNAILAMMETDDDG